MPAMVIALLAVAWLHDERSAAEEAHRSGKELLVDFQADWCAACKMMERHTWVDPRVQREIAEHFVALRLDVTDDEELAMKYRISGLPTVVAGEARLTGYAGPAEMLEWLRHVGHPHCNLTVFSRADRVRHHDLGQLLRANAAQVVELSHGYGLRFDPSRFTEIAEWVSLESRCCPFFTFELELGPQPAGPLWLRLTGNAEVKEFISIEMEPWY